MSKPLLFSEKCKTCIFHPGNRMDLRPGRLQDVINQNRKTGSMLTCHETLDDKPQEQAMCRGFWDSFAKMSLVPQLMERMYGPDWYEETEPKENWKNA